MFYTLAKFFVWAIIGAVIGVCIGWALRSLKCRAEVARARATTIDGDEVERMRHRLANLEQVVAERDRLRMQVADMRHADSPGIVRLTSDLDDADPVTGAVTTGAAMTGGSEPAPDLDPDAVNDTSDADRSKTMVNGDGSDAVEDSDPSVDDAAAIADSDESKADAADSDADAARSDAASEPSAGGAAGADQCAGGGPDDFGSDPDQVDDPNTDTDPNNDDGPNTDTDPNSDDGPDAIGTEDDDGPDATGTEDVGGAGSSEPDLDLAAAKSAIGTTVTLDDLTVVEGIGPKIAELCNGIAVTTWRQLADTEVSELQSMLNAAGSRFKMHEPGSWPRQAELLATGRWDEFMQLATEVDD